MSCLLKMRISKSKTDGSASKDRRKTAVFGRILFAFIAVWCLMMRMKIDCIAVDARSNFDIPDPGQLYAVSAVLMDGESGRVLYDKNGQQALANASTTKILTCITVLENCNVEEELTVSEYAASMPKVKLFIQKGECYKVKDLLYSLMLESHNDSAVALAEHVGKRWVKELSDRQEKDFTQSESLAAVKAFADKMNDKALEIGCGDTCFITPNGLDARETVVGEDGTETIYEHHTTARDLAKIMSYCILRSAQKESFLRITGTAEYSFAAGGRNFTLINHNSFLNMMEGAISGKTGFTGKAGYCYVGALEKDGRYFVVALLACGWPNNKSYKWSDTKKLMQYGMANFHRVNLLGEETLVPMTNLPKLKVEGGQGESIGQEVQISLLIPGRERLAAQKGVLLKAEEKITAKVALSKKVQAPVRQGQKVGEIRYMLGDEVYLTEDILTADAAQQIDLRWCLQQVISLFFRPRRAIYSLLF